MSAVLALGAWGAVLVLTAVGYVREHLVDRDRCARIREMRRTQNMAVVPSGRPEDEWMSAEEWDALMAGLGFTDKPDLLEEAFALPCAPDPKRLA